VSTLSDAAVSRLRKLGNWPEFASPRYVVIEEIGRGGMGTVYRAHDEELGRDVAVKISNAIDRTDFDRRLQREARALARLEHPGIVPIHDAGRLADGRIFYVMKRVEGRTLREHLESVADPVERLRVFERICEPVAFAHARGVVHRDLKPDNVMIGAFGEVIVMDWGLAKAVDDDAEEGNIAGTRGFMAPEQARGAEAEVDHRADVYGLGAILYQLVSSDLLPADADPQSVLRRRGVPRPLAAICAKALQAGPSDRYQTVTALGEDVARYRAGRSVEAYPETIVERALRFGRTYRTAILLVLGYVIMRALVAILAGW
jgi:eukaryotic-like serine/threonine-protein kinase